MPGVCFGRGEGLVGPVAPVAVFVGGEQAPLSSGVPSFTADDQPGSGRPLRGVDEMSCFSDLGGDFASGFRGEGVFPGQSVGFQMRDGILDAAAFAGADAEPNLAAAAFPSQAPASGGVDPDPHPSRCGVFRQGGQRLVQHSRVV